MLAAISLALAWGGREQLETIIGNFLSLLGYWTLCFGTILALEHVWFRPRLGGYNHESWQDQDRMPLGIAGCLSLLFGIGASFLGMDQTWVRLSISLETISLLKDFNTDRSETRYGAAPISAAEMAQTRRFVAKAGGSTT